MSYAMLLGDCGQCGQPFYSAPSYVPSLRLPSGSQLIFCRECVDSANRLRVQRGLPAHYVHPEAYQPEES